MARCLLTGATGFIGSHAATGLSEMGWDVHALTRHPPREVGGARVHVCDGADQREVSRVLGLVDPDVVIHLATCYVKDHEPQDLDRLIESNISFGCRLLEAMSATRCRRMVVTGTAWQHFGRSDDGYHPATLYAATKQAFEDLAIWYADARGMHVTALHLGDTYGPNDPRPKFFSLLASAARNGQPLDLSPGEQTLDPLHVDDAVRALDVAATRLCQDVGSGFERYQATPRTPRTLRELASLWCTANEKAPDLRWGALPYRDREVMQPWQGGRPLPGWQPEVLIECGLKGVGLGREDA